MVSYHPSSKSNETFFLSCAPTHIETHKQFCFRQRARERVYSYDNQSTGCDEIVCCCAKKRNKAVYANASSRRRRSLLIHFASANNSERAVYSPSVTFPNAADMSAFVLSYMARCPAQLRLTGRWRRAMNKTNLDFFSPEFLRSRRLLPDASPCSILL